MAAHWSIAQIDLHSNSLTRVDRAARAAKNTTQKILKLVLVSKRHLILALSASRVFQSFQHLDKKEVLLLLELLTLTLWPWQPYKVANKMHFVADHFLWICNVRV